MKKLLSYNTEKADFEDRRVWYTIEVGDHGIMRYLTDNSLKGFTVLDVRRTFLPSGEINTVFVTVESSVGLIHHFVYD